MEGSDGREKQRSCQASVPEPFCFSSKDAGCYEGIVSIRKEELKCQLVWRQAYYGFAFTKWRTYKALEPGPYWPDTGQAHTTCKALLVAFVAVEF